MKDKEKNESKVSIPAALWARVKVYTDNGKTPRTLPDLQITDTTRTQWFNKRVSVFRSSCVDMYNLGNYIPPPPPPSPPPLPPPLPPPSGDFT
ncbi:hypothetical protein M0804_003574 [Polistes exclamans]|nr:hypothetical protein M0804_003574 [Polistes exclamans]